MRARWIAAGIGLGLWAAAGCESILGLDQRELAEVVGADGAADGTTEAGGADVTQEPSVLPGCELPNDGNASVRVGNLITSLQRVDFCLKPWSEPSFATVRPLFGSYKDCPQGLSFRELSAVFKIAAGDYDIKMIPFGSWCEASGLASLSKATLADGLIQALYAFGDGVQAPVLKSLQETRTSMPTEFKVRLIHAAPSLPPLDFGIADSGKLPAKVASLFFRNVAFGATAPPGDSPSMGKIDANGYVSASMGSGGPLAVAVSANGVPDALLALLGTFSTSKSYTVFAVGGQDNLAFPTQLWSCDETDVAGATPAEKALAKCGNGPARDIKFDVFNTALSGAFAHEKERRQPIFDALSKLDSDVLCVTEIWSNADKDALIDASKSQFPYAYYARHDWSTKVDDPTDQQGNIPPAPTEAACSQSLAAMGKALDCLRDQCATPLGSEGALASSDISDCMTNQCGVSALLPLLSGNTEDKACWSCVLSMLSSYETIGAIRDSCANDPTARFAYRGSDGAMILSRYPISDSKEAWVLPATEYRVAVLRAPITLDNSATFDAYCSVLTTPRASCLTRPYTGAYGNGAAPSQCEAGWSAELVLQSEKLAAWVKTRSLDRKLPAIVAGDFYSGPGYSDGAKVVLTAQYPDAYGKLIQSLVEAVPDGYVPACTLCTDNPILTPPGTPPSAESTWTSTVFMGNVPITLSKSAGTLLTDAFIPMGFADGGSLIIPLSSHYAFRSVLRIEP